jgi:hypothetical protein
VVIRPVPWQWSRVPIPRPDQAVFIKIGDRRKTPADTTRHCRKYTPRACESPLSGFDATECGGYVMAL